MHSYCIRKYLKRNKIKFHDFNFFSTIYRASGYFHGRRLLLFGGGVRRSTEHFPRSTAPRSTLHVHELPGPCKRCNNDLIPPNRQGNHLYCSEVCKIMYSMLEMRKPWEKRLHSSRSVFIPLVLYVSLLWAYAVYMFICCQFCSVEYITSCKADYSRLLISYTAHLWFFMKKFRIFKDIQRHFDFQSWLFSQFRWVIQVSFIRFHEFSWKDIEFSKIF